MFVNSLFVAPALAAGLPPALPEAPTVEYGIKTAPRFITYWASVYGADVEAMLATAQCESGFSSTARGDSGNAYGPFQFWKATFVKYAPRLGLTAADYKNPQAQVQLAAWMFANNRANEWTCFRNWSSSNSTRL